MCETREMNVRFGSIHHVSLACMLTTEVECQLFVHSSNLCMISPDGGARWISYRWKFFGKGGKRPVRLWWWSRLWLRDSKPLRVFSCGFFQVHSSFCLTKPYFKKRKNVNYSHIMCKLWKHNCTIGSHREKLCDKHSASFIGEHRPALDICICIVCQWASADADVHKKLSYVRERVHSSDVKAGIRLAYAGPEQHICNSVNITLGLPKRWSCWF